MSRLRDRRLVLVRGRCLVTIGWSGLVPVVLLGGLFALIAAEVGAPVAGAAVVGALGGSASLLAHELGHVRSARKFPGIRAVSVSLMWGGAATTLEGAYVRGRDQIRVAVAGPAASFTLAVALIPAFCLPLPLGVRDLLLLLLLFNAVVGVVNLIPVEPLDGFKIVVGLLWSALGSETAARRVIRRLALGGLAFEAMTALVLLAEKPMLGSTSVTIAASLYGQKLLVRRVRKLRHT
jgi:Zn-dependent protease